MSWNPCILVHEHVTVIRILTLSFFHYMTRNPQIAARSERHVIIIVIPYNVTQNNEVRQLLFNLVSFFSLRTES